MADPRSLLSHYFLHRLGLISDELYWPSDSSTAALGSTEPRGGEGSPIDEDVLEAWRIRDVITGVLEDNGVACDFNGEAEEGEGGGNAGGVVSISAILDNTSPSEDQVKQFVANKDSYSDVSGKLNIDAVHKAFNAAAYSILKGCKHPQQDSTTPITEEAKYDPPLVRAIESVTASRIDSLNEASGKSVAPFLKKNNTIPWFHIPIVDQRAAAGLKDVPSVVKPKVKKLPAPVVEAKKEVAMRSMEKVKEEWGHTATKPVKRPVENTITPAEKKTKLDQDETTKAAPKPTIKPDSHKSKPVTNTPQPKMENRANVSRAILCAAAALVFQGCTPDYDSDSQPHDTTAAEGAALVKTTTQKQWDINPQEMPLHIIETEQAKRVASKKKRDLDITVEMAMEKAGIMAQRALDRMNGAARRNDARMEFRKSVGKERVERGFNLFQRGSGSGSGNKWVVAPGHSLPLILPNPFGMEERQWTDGEAMDTDEELLTNGPLKKEEDGEWSNACLPRLLSILRKGSGHAILHDLEWKDRAWRVAELLRSMAEPASSPPGEPTRTNYGPHLIVTSSQDFDAFAKVFAQMGHGLRVVRSADEKAENSVLRILSYNGSEEKRRRLRKHFGSLVPPPDSPFCFTGGQRDSPYHVVLTTYAAFGEDYAHFCQIPFQAVVIDDGMSWLGCAHADANSKLGKVWDTGLWSSADHGSGMAGCSSGVSSAWDFSKDDGGIESDKGSNLAKSPARRDSTSSVQGEKSNRGKLLVGLTARHRILVASKMHVSCNGHVYKAPISSLLTFLAPHFMDIVRDDWDRSKMSQCERSMSYIRTLIARSIVVYSGTSIGSCANDLFSSAVKSLNAGVYPSGSSLLSVVSHIGEGAKSASLQRKDAMAWFRPSSALPKEINDSLLDSILATLKSFNSMGFVCEEIVPASTLTTSGANGTVTGPAAYRTAVRCGRPFSNEQSLKQHIAAFHSPAGTWLCSSCGVDCVTSQARAHHERSCSTLDDAQDMLISAANANLPPKDNRRGPKKKEAKNLAAAKVTKDNFTLVSGFRGVYLMPNGKHCIKIDGKVITNNSSQEDSEEETPLSFDLAEEAAKRHDQILKGSGNTKESEMNYEADGSRIFHAKETAAVSTRDDAGALEGGTGNNAIVPALAVINIKDLPKDVKPLLRDPNQTSRTGGNSKRYVYAYRGVCRQARKGHDRWQAQISFNGCNHYLGTFDSEWDAAAVYAWAHLILYGEEATKKAQQEGEEAAAAYEQLQKDIAAGKVPPPAPTPPKKKKNPPGAPKGVARGPRKKKEATPAAATTDVVSVPVVSKKETDQAEKEETIAPKKVEKKETSHQRIVEIPIQSKSVEKESTYTSMYSKKDIPTTLAEWMKLKTGCAMMLSSGTKGTSKATLLASKKNLASMSNTNLFDNVALHSTSGSTSFLKSIMSFGDSFKSLPTCIALSTFAPSLLPRNGALLIGLSAAKFSWDPEKFISTCQSSGEPSAIECKGRLFKEYGRVGMNTSFRSLLLSCPCIIGQATKESQQIYSAVRINETQGMTVGSVGCNVAGPDHSCSPAAARIELCPTQDRFQFLACNDEDIVTLNGQRIQSSMGPFPLQNNDICSVGPRVFAFVRYFNT